MVDMGCWFEIGFSPFHLMKSILSISNEKLEIKIDAFNSIYKVNVGTSLKNLDNVK
jgi:hypothetical protein